MTVIAQFARTASLALILSLGAAPLAFAAGSDSSEPPTKTETSTKCTDGKVWDKKKKECVEPDQSGFNDSELYDNARELAYDGQYDHAIRILQLAKNQEDPRILNYLGFANRKAGRMELGMSYYKRAIAADANYILARSYMGQALVQQGEIEAARLELIEIRDRGGENSWAYRSLAQALETGITY